MSFGSEMAINIHCVLTESLNVKWCELAFKNNWFMRVIKRRLGVKCH